MTDGTFQSFVGFMSHVHLGKSPEKTFGKGDAHSEQTWWAIGRTLYRIQSRPIRFFFVWFLPDEPGSDSIEASYWSEPCGELHYIAVFQVKPAQE